ncbi:MAG: diguanylate cyclase [Actinobacteria bacterium]|nr:diguanylate cyclase [Actinomycetota bacterium]
MFINLVGGLILIAIAVLAPSMAPPGMALFAVFVLLNAVAAVAGLKLVGDADWGLYFRVAQSWVVFIGFAFVMGSGRVAFIWLPVVALVSVTSLYGVRRGIPFVIAGPLLSGAAALVSDVPGNAQLAYVVVLGTAAVGGALLLVQYHVRLYARENRRLAETDELTGAANMRSLRLRLAELLRPEANADARPFALFALDLDEFKRVNDEFDHGTGDRVLRAVARELAAEVDESDMVVRRGGDEFSVLAPKIDGRDLEELSSRLRSAIRRARLTECPEVTPSGSVGYAICRPGEELPVVLERADDELHESKLGYRRRAGAAALRRTPVSEGFVPSAGAVGDGAPTAKGREVKLVWNIAAIAFGMAGLALVGMALPRMITGFGTFQMSMGIALLSLAGGALTARDRLAHSRWIKPMFLAALAFVALSTKDTGDAGLAVYNLLIPLSLFSFILFGARMAGAVALGGLAAFAAMVVTAQVEYAAMTAICALFVVAVSATIIAKVRSVTKRFIRAYLELSERDSLTGMANLRALRARVTNAVNRSEGEHGDLAVVAFDLDEFKTTNERYNHTVGDSVLVASARALNESARVDDLVARRGGDEFYVVIEQASETDLMHFADRMAAAISHARHRVCPDISSTASYAVATYGPGDDAEALLTKADLALHESKCLTHRARGRELALTA